MEHRRDIDGLRAVAVGSVVAYHLGVAHVGGGFVGVDVFFVISGFLITGLITGELAEDRFTITDFYRRRLRRIVPALLLVLLATCGAAAVLLFDSELHDLRESVLSAGVFGSNFWFWQHSGYFDAPSTAQPLLHTWSLAVEEQFYVVFPILLVTLHRWWRSRLRLVLLVLTLASLALSIVQVRHGDVGAAFYLLPARAWELGVGALLATGRRSSLRPLVAHAASGLGLLLIAFAALHYTDATRFPGAAALPPVLGAALIIWAGPGAVIGKVLSWRPFVFIGLVSYSWYLWHWPMIVIYRLWSFDALDTTSRLVIGASSFVLAVLSWRFVEGPLRRMRLPGRPRVIGFAVASTAAVLVLGLVLQPFSRAVHPITAQERAVLTSTNITDGNYFRTGTCFISTGYTVGDFPASTCLGTAPGKPTVLLLGDSHAADLWQGLSEALPTAVVQQATASGCLPDLHPVGTARCVALIRQILFDYLPQHHVDVVVLSARWRPAEAPQVEALVAAIRTVVPHVVLVGPSPDYLAPLPALLARSLDRGDAGLPARHLDPAQVLVDHQLQTATVAAGVTYVSLVGELCSKGTCRTLASPGVALQVDDGHFSLAGARLADVAITRAVLEALGAG